MNVDRHEVRIFTLCDHAALPPDGKLYLNGAGVHQILVPQLPGPLGPLFLVIRVAVPWQLLGEPHTIKVRALDLDRKPVGPVDPLIEAPVELGKPAGFRPGDEAAANIVVQLTGLPIAEAGTIHFHLLVDDETLATLPLKVQETRSQPR